MSSLAIPGLHVTCVIVIVEREREGVQRVAAPELRPGAVPAWLWHQAFKRHVRSPTAASRDPHVHERSCGHVISPSHNRHGDKSQPDRKTFRRAALDNTNCYVDCLNGTVTDTVTGLIWLKQADCLARANYSAANQAAAGLKAGDCSLTDGSSPGDWRLPTRDEWRATIAQAVALGCKSSGPGTPRR